MTAFDIGGIKNCAHAYGCIRLMRKPFDVHDMRATILRALAHRDSFAGSLSELATVDVIQMLCIARKTIALRLTEGPSAGVVHIENGEIVHAVWDSLVGEDAFFRIMAVKRGLFSTLPCPLTSSARYTAIGNSCSLRARGSSTRPKAKLRRESEANPSKRMLPMPIGRALALPSRGSSAPPTLESSHQSESGSFLPQPPAPHQPLALAFGFPEPCRRGERSSHRSRRPAFQRRGGPPRRPGLPRPARRASRRSAAGLGRSAPPRTFEPSDRAELEEARGRTRSVQPPFVPTRPGGSLSHAAFRVARPRPGHPSAPAAPCCRFPWAPACRAPAAPPPRPSPPRARALVANPLCRANNRWRGAGSTCAVPRTWVLEVPAPEGPHL